MMEVFVKTLDKKIEADEGSNLLDVLLENNIPISYSCMSGRCSTCQCSLVEGEVSKKEGVAENSLLGDENTILACTSIMSNKNITIEIPEPDEIVQHVAVKRKGTITNYTKVTDDVRVLRVKPNKPVDFTGGQYVQIQFGNESPRSYSMATTAKDSELEFHIRIIPDGRVTSKLDAIAENNEKLRITGPLGASYVRLKNDDPIICIGGGTGLAPMVSVARGALEANNLKSVELFFGVKYEQDIYYVDELKALQKEYPNFTYHVVVECADENSSYLSGYVTDAVAKTHKNLAGFRVYLGGSPPMVDAASALVKDLGADPTRVYSDAFFDSSI
jgi:ferredoxin-NAD(P)+ reductase (naphthalene dioxygenase ferredoxin-specific)